MELRDRSQYSHSVLAKLRLFYWVGHLTLFGLATLRLPEQLYAGNWPSLKRLSSYQT